MGNPQDTFGLSEDVGRKRTLALHVRPHGKFLTTSLGDLVETLGRGSLLALRIGLYADVLRTSLGDILRTLVGNVPWRYM